MRGFALSSLHIASVAIARALEVKGRYAQQRLVHHSTEGFNINKVTIQPSILLARLRAQCPLSFDCYKTQWESGLM